MATSIKVAVTEEKAKEIEERTRNQAESEQWALERRQCVTASKFGSIVKMRAATKRSKKVEELLYSSFGGNAATCYGILKETETVQQYIIHQKNHRHPLTVLMWVNCVYCQCLASCQP